MESLVKSFVIGSSAFITVPKLIRVGKIPKESWNWNYEDYSLFMPISYGLVAVAANITRSQFSMSIFTSIFILYIIVGITQYVVIRKFKFYNYTPEQWRKYFIRITILNHGIFYFIIFLLEKYLNES